MKSPVTKEVQDEIIKLYALYGAPHLVYRKLKADFGDDCPTAHVVTKMRESHRAHILTMRKEMSKKIPLMDPEERWVILQAILDSALEGDVIKNVRGDVTVRVDRPSALAALKLAQDMTQATGVVQDENDDYVREVVQEAYREMRDSNPERSGKDILNEILMNLGDQVRPYVEEMRELITITESKA